MSLLYPSFLWLFIPLLVAAKTYRPHDLLSRVRFIVLGLILLAAARPYSEGEIEKTAIEAREILIALDVSYSMRANDLKPSRYAFAKKTIEAILERNRQDSIMLFAFTTNPLLLAPPTTDHRLVADALDALVPENILTKGTSLQRLFAKIATLEKRPRVIVLMTDGGEENDFHPLTETLNADGNRLIVLATGTQSGSTVPLSDGKKLKNERGDLVVSRINPMLPQLAHAFSGSYLLPKSTPEATAEALLRQIDTLDLSRRHLQKERRATHEYYPVLLLLSALLFIVAHTKASKYLSALFALTLLPLHAGIFDGVHLHEAYALYKKGDLNASRTALQKIDTPNLQQRYALGIISYKQGEYEKSRAYFQSIHTTSVEVKRRILYNIANTYAMQGAYAKAEKYYTKALQLGEDADALHNLRLVNRLRKSERLHKGRSRPASQQEGDTAASDLLDPSEKATSSQQRNGSKGAGGSKQASQERQNEKGAPKYRDAKSAPMPLGSKIYELINKGYIRETHPW